MRLHSIFLISKMFINLLRADFEFLSLGISKVSDFNNTNEMNLCAGVYMCVGKTSYFFKVEENLITFLIYTNLIQFNAV